MTRRHRSTTTTIIVNGEIWHVPRGFGAWYRREAQRQSREAGAGKPGDVIDIVIDIMSLVGYAPTALAVAEWPLRKRVEAVVHCITIHARASDNPIQRHPEPEWLKGIQPWKGPTHGTGVFSAPSPTRIAS